MSLAPADAALDALLASALAWAAILAAARLDLARWVWVPALRAFGALSIASAAFLLLGLPVPAWAPAALAVAGLATGAAWARLRAPPTGGVA